MNDLKILVTASEAAKMLAMGQSTFWRKVAEKKLPQPVKVARGVLREALGLFLAETEGARNLSATATYEHDAMFDAMHAPALAVATGFELLRQYRLHRPGDEALIHAGFVVLANSKDRPIRPLAPEWRCGRHSNNTTHVLWHK